MKTTGLKAIGLAAILALGLPACSFPPYDEGLSLGMLTARKMDAVGSIGPLNLWYEEFQGLDTAFLLSKSNLIDGAPIEGYFVAVGAYNLQIFAVEYGTTHTLGESRWEGLPNTHSEQHPLVLEMAKDSSNGGGDLYAFAFSDADAHLLTKDLLQPLDGEGIFPLEPLIAADFPGSDPRVIGVTVVPAASLDYDEVLVLWRDEVSRQYREARYRTEHSPPPPYLSPGAPNDVRLGAGFAGLPSTIDLGFYGHHAASGRSYLSVYIDGQDTYRTYRWDDTLTVTELTAMDRRVDRILSNGLLFSYGETMGYVYDAAGVEVNRFPLGDLRLSCEITVGATPRLFFTLPTWGRGGNDSDDFLFVLVYSIPTSEIDEL
ncbi:MAG: hypothetical protein JW820_20260 [Spirochaetales bacterium]|nr:hypothetical protein [Spirochaetales bacterium]